MKERERTKVIVDETTVYEIDLDCCECMEKSGEESGEERKKSDWDQSYR